LISYFGFNNKDSLNLVIAFLGFVYIFYGPFCPLFWSSQSIEISGWLKARGEGRITASEPKRPSESGRWKMKRCDLTNQQAKSQQSTYQKASRNQK